MITRLSTLLLVFALTFLAFKVRGKQPARKPRWRKHPGAGSAQEWHLPSSPGSRAVARLHATDHRDPACHSDEDSVASPGARADPEALKSTQASARFVMERQDARSYGLARKTLPPPAAPTPAPTPVPTPAPIAFVAPPPPPPPVPTAGIEGLICSYAWNCQEALSVARCESGLRPDAIGGSNYGLFQMNQVHANRFPGFWELWSDPVSNASWAFQLWSASGWRPWGCRPY
jgi:hypothetical protein